MESVVTNTPSPYQVQELRHIRIMVLEGKSLHEIGEAWKALVEDATDGLALKDGVDVFAGIWTGLQDALNELKIEKDDEIRLCLARANHQEALRKQARADLQKMRQQMEEYLHALEDQLVRLDDAAQLSQFDLQKVYQDYQQAVSTISEITRQCHDDAMKIINNLR